MSPDFKREVAVSMNYPQLSATLLLLKTLFFFSKWDVAQVWLNGVILMLLVMLTWYSKSFSLIWLLRFTCWTGWKHRAGVNIWRWSGSEFPMSVTRKFSRVQNTSRSRTRDSKDQVCSCSSFPLTDMSSRVKTHPQLLPVKIRSC